MDWTVLIDLVVVAGVAVVCPLALGRAHWWWLAAASAGLAAALPTGPGAAACAAVWVLVAGSSLVRALASAPFPGRTTAGIVDLAVRAGPSAFAVVAALAFLASRGGVAPFGIDEPIVELTAVHFTYAGVGALTLAGMVGAGRSITRAVAVLVTVAAPPLVAIGFLTHHPLPQVGGAVLMSVGVLFVAVHQLRDACTSTTPRRVLLAVSGLAPWVPMVLAVAWASSLYVDVPALSIPDMARTHGVLNVVFVVAGLLARRAGPTATTPAVPDARPAPELVTR